MADQVSLEFLQRQQLDLITEIRGLRADLAQSFRLLTDTQVSIGRTLSALDRRMSEVKDDLETTIRMELVGHRNVTSDMVERQGHEVREELLRTMTEIFDKRYAPREPAGH
jgi:hypothetical protein